MDERGIKRELQERSHGYQSVSATAVPEWIWGTPAAKKYFAGAQGIIIADVLPKNHPWAHSSKNVRLFPVEFGHIADEVPQFDQPLIRDGDVWRLVPGRHTRTVLFALRQSDLKAEPPHTMQSPPPATIEYGGHLVSGEVVQVFDASRRLLIHFASFYQELPWVGPPES